MCRRVRLGALAPPCNRLQKADMSAVPISCCWLLPSIYDAIPSRRLHWFSCRVSWGPSQSWHRRILWCALLSWHNNYIRGAVWLQPIQRVFIQRCDLYLGVAPFASTDPVRFVTSRSYTSSRTAGTNLLYAGHERTVSPASSHVSVCRPARTCGGSQRHRNLLRIHQWQAAAFLINSVWSSRCIRPHFAQSGTRARWIRKGLKSHFMCAFAYKTHFQVDC